MTAADRILEVLAGATPVGMSSAGLCKATGLSPVRVFPALHALEQRGAISSEWEHLQPTLEPRRRLYWIARRALPPSEKGDNHG